MTYNPKLLQIKQRHLIISFLILSVMFSGVLLFENWRDAHEQQQVLGVDNGN